MDTVSYEQDVVVWANQQAALLRAGRLSELDIEHIAEEIEDVGKSEQRELANRMAVLLAHLLKWQYQPERQCVSWSRTIKVQRKGVLARLKNTPSLNKKLNDSEWRAAVYDDAVSQAIEETGQSHFPDDFPWLMDEVLTEGWLPGGEQGAGGRERSGKE